MTSRFVCFVREKSNREQSAAVEYYYCCVRTLLLQYIHDTGFSDGRTGSRNLGYSPAAVRTGVCTRSSNAVCVCGDEDFSTANVGACHDRCRSPISRNNNKKQKKKVMPRMQRRTKTNMTKRRSGTTPYIRPFKQILSRGRLPSQAYGQRVYNPFLVGASTKPDEAHCPPGASNNHVDMYDAYANYARVH